MVLIVLHSSSQAASYVIFYYKTVYIECEKGRELKSENKPVDKFPDFAHQI